MKKGKSQWILQKYEKNKNKKGERKYYEQLYTNKFDILEEMETF